MNINFIIFAFILIRSDFARGEGFFSKFLNRGKSESDYVNDESDACKTVRTMPRIALAVVGGSPMKNAISAPYIVAIGDKSSEGTVSWFCGGSLVSSKDVLTAAHCLISRNATLVRVGSFSAKQRLTGNDYEISETIIHPSYKITESYHDIAVVKIKDKINFTNNIKPVCLPQDDRERYERERARVVGWGAEEFGGEGTKKLQQVEVEVFSNSNCDKAYSNSTIAPKNFPRGIKREQLCAGSSTGGKDACQGDSGGPLVLTDDSGIIRLIGVVSTGAGCGFKQYPGVYTRVSSYYDWIQEQINKKDSNKEMKAEVKTPNSRDSSRGNGQSSQYKKAPQDRPSPNYLTTPNNQRKSNKKHQSREQNSAEISHYNRPTESFHAPESTIPFSSIGSNKSSHSSLSPSQSSFTSKHDNSFYTSMTSQSQQSLNSYSSHQITSQSENSLIHAQPQNFAKQSSTHSEYSSVSGRPFSQPNPQQPSFSSQVPQSSYQVNAQQPFYSSPISRVPQQSNS